MALLDDLIGRITGMPADARAQLEKEVMAATAGRFFIPSPGPQTEAYLSQADEVYYGGEAGGGKSALLVGLALEEHNRQPDPAPRERRREGHRQGRPGVRR